MDLLDNTLGLEKSQRFGDISVTELAETPTWWKIVVALFLSTQIISLFFTEIFANLTRLTVLAKLRDSETIPKVSIVQVEAEIPGFQNQLELLFSLDVNSNVSIQTDYRHLNQ